MGMKVFITEKPSVAQAFASALKLNTKKGNGFVIDETKGVILTWCVGHLVGLCYPHDYDMKLKKWSFETLPFLPDTYKYCVLENTRKQFEIVKSILTRNDVERIYVCTDSGREGEYIYRLVDQEAKVTCPDKRRVWIDSQTDDAIVDGIKNAKDISEYDNISDAAYLRAKEDFLMGINFSRALTLKYSRGIASFLGMDYAVISVGRVMTCVLGMVVKREREIREFVKTPFYKVNANLCLFKNQKTVPASFKALEGSNYFESPLLYSENGFKEKTTAEEMVDRLKDFKAVVVSNTKKEEKKNPPLLFNLAELQSECSKIFKISPAETLEVIQELYEKKMVTYPRTDARVLSSAVAKEINKNISGLRNYSVCSEIAKDVLNNDSWKKISKSKYVDDKQITDHYAVIPTGQGLNNLSSLNPLKAKIYEMIVRRFLSIFYPAAIYEKRNLTVRIDTEFFISNFKVLKFEGYLSVSKCSFLNKPDEKNTESSDENKQESEDLENKKVSEEDEELNIDASFMETINQFKQGCEIDVADYVINEGETSAPKRYTQGSMIKAMENAGQQIDDNEEFRLQLKGAGIGTSATRAGILEKLLKNKYLKVNKKTQVLSPELYGEMIYDVVNNSIKPLLDPKLTASWEKGLSQVADGTTSADEYMTKLNDYIKRRTESVRTMANEGQLVYLYRQAATFYKTDKKTSARKSKK